MNQEFLEVCPVSYHSLVGNSIEVWGWEIAAYLFLGGLVAGLMILTAALELKTGRKPRTRGMQWMPFIGLGLISLGMVALFLDLHHKMHFWRFYLAFKPASPMSWGAWILLLIYPTGALLGLGGLPDSTREWLAEWKLVRALRLKKLLAWGFRTADGHRRGLLWTSVVVGAALGIYTGLLLGTMVARIQWNSAVLGPLFLFSGLSTGAAFLLLFRPGDEEKHLLVRWDVLAILGELFFLVLMLISFAGGNLTAQMAGDNLMGGTWTALFWGLVVATGLVVPLVMNGIEIVRKLPLTLVTPIFVLVGGIALRGVLLAAGQESCFCALR